MKKGHDKPVNVYIWFDIEDYVTEQANELPLRALEILGRHGITATCKMVAEKVRFLKACGREDVISAIAGQDVGYHLDTHSRHPTVYEYFADKDTVGGAKEFLRKESDGLRLVEETFGRKASCFGHPGPAWSTHFYPAMKDMGIPVYLDETAIVNVDNLPYYLCGVLNLNGANENFISFDYSFEREQGIHELRRKFSAARERVRSSGKAAAISVLWHLHTAINRRFWDEVNFGHGSNRDAGDYERPPAQPPEVTERAWKDFEEFVAYMASFEDVRFITASDAPRLYPRTVPTTISRTTLKQVARSVASRISHVEVEGYLLSPAQVFYAVAAAFADGDEDSQVRVREPLGPMKVGRTTGETTNVSISSYRHASKAALEFMDSEGCMPSAITVESGVTLTPEDFLATGARLLVDEEGATDDARVVLTRGNFAQSARVNEEAFVKACTWPVLPPNFSAPKILEQIRLQTWTLVPAVAAV